MPFALNQQDGCDALMLAVQHGHMSTVEQLMALGADAHGSCCGGRTLMHAAAARNDIAMLELLLPHIGLEARVPSSQNTPLMVRVAPVST